MLRTVLNITLTACRRITSRWCTYLVLVSALTLPALAHADVLTDWNAITEAVVPRFGGPQQQSRVFTMVQIAVHDAHNAIEPRYARYTQVGLVKSGARRASRLREERHIARFWPGDGGNWNRNRRIIVNGLGLDRWQHARLFALLNIAQTDAYVANLTWKYIHHFWRPVTAIRWEDDGNPETVSDPVWRVLPIRYPARDTRRIVD